VNGMRPCFLSLCATWPTIPAPGAAGNGWFGFIGLMDDTAKKRASPETGGCPNQRSSCCRRDSQPSGGLSGKSPGPSSIGEASTFYVPFIKTLSSILPDLLFIVFFFVLVVGNA